MAYDESASQVWTRLANVKSATITKVERFAALTIPKVLLMEGTNPDDTLQSHDWQSLGAQAVNHVVNKLMIAMFAPSRPFFRMSPGKDTKKKAAEAGIPETSIGDILAKAERDAVQELDKRGQRPKLYQACRHLVVTGNVLLVLGKETMRVMGLRYFCVKRTAEGGVHTLVIREHIRFDELDTDIQDLLGRRYGSDDKVHHYKLICRQPDGSYRMSQWINETRLPGEWNARWTEERMPYRVLTWDLADEADYATGLVEDYYADFEALSTLAESIVTGAVQATEFRWVANPNGVTSPDDLRDSDNGDVIPGTTKDVGAVSPPVGEGVKLADAVEAKYTQRISRGFLLTSAVTRDAERVTAEEIRATAMELENSFGGVYSSLAPSLQKPMAEWLLRAADADIAGTDFGITIITGLDALSRNGDLENLTQGLRILNEVGSAAAPELQRRLKWQELADFVGQGVGVDLKRFVKDDGTIAQEDQAAAEHQANTDVSVAAGTAQAEAAAQPTTPPQ